MENRLPRPLPSISDLAARLAAVDRQIEDLQAERAVLYRAARRQRIGKDRLRALALAARSPSPGGAKPGSGD